MFYVYVERYYKTTGQDGGFGGLVVSMLASGTQVRGFKLSDFSGKKSSACLPSEGK
jgi:hypothetical protein